MVNYKNINSSSASTTCFIWYLTWEVYLEPCQTFPQLTNFTNAMDVRRGSRHTPELGVVDVAYLYVVKWKLLVMIVAGLQF